MPKSERERLAETFWRQAADHKGQSRAAATSGNVGEANMQRAMATGNEAAAAALEAGTVTSGEEALNLYQRVAEKTFSQLEDERFKHTKRGS